MTHSKVSRTVKVRYTNDEAITHGPFVSEDEQLDFAANKQIENADVKSISIITTFWM